MVLTAKFLRRLTLDPAQPDCLLWTGQLSNDGFGIFYLGQGRKVPAHRWWWENQNGPIPEHHHLWSTCGTRRCVSVGHHRLQDARPLPKSPRTRPRFSACKRGHLVTPTNTRITPQGRKRCRVCDRLAKQQKRDQS